MYSVLKEEKPFFEAYGAFETKMRHLDSALQERLSREEKQVQAVTMPESLLFDPGFRKYRKQLEMVLGLCTAA